MAKKTKLLTKGEKKTSPRESLGGFIPQTCPIAGPRDAKGFGEREKKRKKNRPGRCTNFTPSIKKHYSLPRAEGPWEGERGKKSWKPTQSGGKKLANGDTLLVKKQTRKRESQEKRAERRFRKKQS